MHLSAQTDYQKKLFSSPEIQALIHTIDQHPDSAALHTQLFDKMGTTRLQNPLLMAQYDRWLAKFPKVAGISLALGKAYYSYERPEATNYLLKAVELDPSNADTWFTLSIRLGDQTLSSSYQQKAVELRPDNEGYAFSYAVGLKDIDSAKFRAELFKAINKFPKSPIGATCVYILAGGTKDTVQKTTLLEDMYSKYPPKRYPVTANAMQDLFNIYLDRSPQKAPDLADTMRWKNRKNYAANWLMINDAIAKQQYAQALALVDSSKRIAGIPNDQRLDLTLASIKDLTGDTQTAYSDLVKMMAAQPTTKIAAQLHSYAVKLNKTETDINADIGIILNASAKVAPNFATKLYTEDRSVSFANYRGKVILLTFWFPGCGPCRAEFPSFERVIKKFSKDQVTYLGINAIPEQDGYVASFMQRSGVSFTALHGRAEVVEKLFNFKGYPANFLIDGQGRIIYSNFRIDENNEDTLQLMINNILHKDALPVNDIKLADTAKIK